MKYLVSILVLVTALFGSDLEWSNDYKAALEIAKKENKQVYMLVTSESCRWCRKFESTTLQDDGIIQRLESKYVLLHISREKDYMPSKFKKKRVPRHYFLTSDAQVVETFLGYWNVLDFNSFLDDVDVINAKNKGKI